MKPHLLLVHSFPTNSILLHGLAEFLSDYFTVHFIDLPGFHRDCPSVDIKKSLDVFSEYFDQRIAELEIDEYIVGGVSFGFTVVNNAKLDKRCKAILAIEPFMGSKYLRASFRIIPLMIAVRGIYALCIEKPVWKSKWFQQYLQYSSGYPKERIDIIIEHIDPVTFFSVARLMLQYNKEIVFHDLPYFLIGNSEDRTINFSSVVEIFRNNTSQLQVISVPIDHYPVNPSKEYFKSKISSDYIHKILAEM